MVFTTNWINQLLLELQLICCSCIVLVQIREASVHGSSTSFSFDSFETRNLTLLGDTFIKSSNLGLTRDTPVPATSVGRALYMEPVKFWDAATNVCVSFQTSFAFSMSSGSSNLKGDGLAFIIVPDNTTLGSPGKWLGLINATSGTINSTINGSSTCTQPCFLAVEFDTYLDVGFFDINDNHVGVDSASLVSIAAADVGTVGMNLKSGDVISAWIDYNSSSAAMEVRVSYTGQRPEEPLLVASIVLRDVVEEVMFVGFSASTEGSQEEHTVYAWSFETSGLDDSAQRDDHDGDSDHYAPVPSPSLQNYARNPAPLNISLSPARSCRRSPLCLSFGAFLGLSVGSAFGLAFLILACMGCAYKAWNNGWCLGRSIGSDQWRRTRKSDLYVSEAELLSGPRKFTYKQLSLATKGFSASRVVGHGAFGAVYKGILPDTGAMVAVKRSMQGDSEGRSELLAELSIIGCLRHRNLVQLLGWCYENDEILLIYDYMEQGSLDRFLFSRDGTAMVLPWMQRYKIVTGVAAALAYLHDECEQQVVHRDVKASNIMLDGRFNARLGDFGLARLTDHNKSPDATLAAGTMGYLAPEYIHTGKATEKTDVFSFGAVVLEVACGRRPLEKDLPPAQNVLVDWVWGLHRFGPSRLLEAADPRLGGDFVEAEMVRMLQVGLLCSHPDPAGRPTMRHVVQILTGEASMPPVPRFKPTPSFALLHLPLSLQELIAESSNHTSTSLDPHPLSPPPSTSSP